MALSTEKTMNTAKLFPEIFAANQEKFFSGMIKNYGDNPDQYLENMQNAQQSQPAQPVQPPTTTKSSMTDQLTAPTKSLEALTGAGV